MANRRSLRGRPILVTGGARGIGRATAAELARRGAAVTIGDLDASAAATAARKLGVHAETLDVTDPASLGRALDAVEERHGPIRALVNNAGLMHPGPLAAEADLDTARQLSVNVLGVINGSKLAARRMRGRGGHIVNVASTLGKMGIAGAATYCATKHAVVGLSEALCAELAPEGVDVSLVMPHATGTELMSGVGALRVSPITPERVARAIAGALERPRFEVYVPAWHFPVGRLQPILPWRLRTSVRRVAGGDFTRVDAAARARYLARTRPRSA